MMNDNATEIKKARREYYRECRKNNPDRVAQIQERYWLKKAKELRRQEPVNGHSHIPPPNSEATVSGGWIWNRAAKKAVYVPGKGFNKPLFDTGALYDAFDYEIEE